MYYSSLYLFHFILISQVWVLTGDKQETAVNISHSCGHIKQGMNVMLVTQKDSAESAQRELSQHEQT